MALEPNDLDFIEGLTFKNADDSAVAIARSFERVEERLGDMETRISGRLSSVRDAIDGSCEDILNRLPRLTSDE